MQTTKRRRLTPDERINEILDAAAELVVETGIAQLNMERIAQKAGVSKGLVYAYFPNVTVLLQEVLKREHRALQVQQMQAISSTGSFEEMARATAHNNHERYNERGLLIERLRGDPAVADAMRNTDRKTRRAVVDYLTGQVTDNYDMPDDVARLATELVIGPGHEYQRISADRLRKMDEVWGAMMVGAMKELEKRYGKTVTEKKEG